mmetsp:Transcript_41348/g.76969  ORF Transcript_41348/g.76969 Transcript_41348/m.76969 type:complete len:234 (-) Transcript_41348:25-726(-)
MVALEGLVLLQQADMPEHFLWILTLLEAHDIIGRIHGALDEVASAVSPAAFHLEEMPPKEVVGEDLDLETSPRFRRHPKLGRDGVFAPLAWRRHRARARALRMRGVVGFELPCRQRGVLCHSRIPIWMLRHANVLPPHNGLPTGTAVSFSDVMASRPCLGLLLLVHCAALSTSNLQRTQCTTSIVAALFVCRQLARQPTTDDSKGCTREGGRPKNHHKRGESVLDSSAFCIKS